MKVVNDETSDAVVVLRNHTHPLPIIEHGRKVIHYHTINPCTYQTHNDHAEIVDEECRAADDGTRDADRGTYIEMKILIDNLSEYVESTR